MVIFAVFTLEVLYCTEWLVSFMIFPLPSIQYTDISYTVYTLILTDAYESLNE